MCDVKLVDKRNTEELMDMSVLKEAADKLAKANRMRWYGHVLRQPEENVLMKAMVLEVDEKCNQGQPMVKWRKQVKGSMRRIGLKKKDVQVVGCIRSPPFIENI